MSKNKKFFQFGSIAITVLLLVVSSFAVQAKTKLKVFHAGSLSIPFKQVEKEFEQTHPNVDVQLEAHVSVVAVRQVTEVGKRGDVVAVADYSLIPSMMDPDYSDFYLQFAQNRMVVAYNENSKLSDRINSDNWYNILAHPKVRFGFSNPNMDPCGYRSPMVMQLAELHYFDSRILDELVLANSAISVADDGNKYEIQTPEALKPRADKLSIRNKSVDLVALVQSGGLDYAFEYMSVAKQHGLKFVTLPRQIDLSSTKYSETYKRVEVKTADGKIKVAKPIVYGITVPNNAPNPELAKDFVELIISERGQEIFTELGQPPIVPARGFGEVPSALESLVE